MSAFNPHPNAPAPLTATLDRLRAVFSRVLNEVVPPGPVALLDFPDHPNVGDSAIWLGECVWLATRKDCPVVYVADKDNFNLEALVRAMPTGTVLLHGGGNFGDLWPDCQAAREGYLRALPQYRIVQLPQSIWFGDARATERAGATARAHPDFIMLARSEDCFTLATQRLGLPQVRLVPDAAFLLGSLHADEASQQVVHLARTDHERLPAGLWNGVTGEDWMVDSWPVSQWKARMVTQWCFGQDGWRGRMLAPRWANYLARQRVDRGLKQLARGRTVVTDRLHACLLGVLLRRRVIALDNCYGKLRSVMNTWLPGYPGITWVTDPTSLEEALALADD